MLNQDAGDLDNTQKVKDDAARNQARTWETFSNHAAGKGNSVISIESWHDDIHDLIRGQMGDPAVAGVCPSLSVFGMQTANFFGSLILSFGSIIGKFSVGKPGTERLIIVLVISIAYLLCFKCCIPINMFPRTVK